MSLPLDDMRSVGRQYGATLNDMVMTLVDEGVHRYLRRTDRAFPHRLVAFCPISLREKDDVEAATKVTAAFVHLGGHDATVTERIGQVVAAMTAAKAEIRALSKEAAMVYAVAVLGLAQASTASGIGRVAPPLANLVISNVPGAPHAMYVNGARLLGMYSASAKEIGCDVLILACNGFGGNKEMLKKHIPEAVDLFYEGHVGNQGDAIRWGEELGASVKDIGSFQGHGAVCSPHGMHLGWATVTEGGFHVNKDGKRFSNENAGYSEQALKVHRQPGNVAWAIWDERCEKIANQQHSHMEANESGAIKRFDAIAPMAKAIGCDAGALEQTFAEVAAVVRGEKKDAFERNFGSKPVLRPPYYMSKIMGALTHTQGGLEINRDARVLRKDGTPFPNLFAGGGAARGLSGPADWGYLSGSGLMMATNTGRLAGEAAAAQVKKGQA